MATRMIGHIERMAEEQRQLARDIEDHDDYRRKFLMTPGDKIAAEKKSYAILKQSLTKKQRNQLFWDGYFEVIGNESGMTYRIYNFNRSYSIDVMDNGKAFQSMCFVPIFENIYPMGDRLLTQKVYLELNETHTIKIANFSTPIERYHNSRRERWKFTASLMFSIILCALIITLWLSL